MPTDTSRVQDNESVPVTKLRNIRVDDDLWTEAKRIASERRETLSAVVKRALVEYVEKHGGRIER
jgi:predicted transcriptional regulator